MGGGSWSTHKYEDRAASKAAAGIPTFDYHDTTSRRPRYTWTAHPSLDPKGLNTNGEIIRESRDSDEHPDSVAIAVFFDVTGSMGGIPVVLQKKLPDLFGLLLRKGYVSDPQLLFGAIGDAYSDRVPLQVGQFESDNRSAENLESMMLEGGGGGGNHESYQLAAYFMARHSSIDCWEKRGRKGYIFLIGDERVYDRIDRHQVQDLIGDSLQEDLTTEEIFRELRERFEVFYLFAAQGSYEPDQVVTVPNSNGAMGWRTLLGQNVIILEDADSVCETIALTIGLTEGTIDLAEGVDHLKEIGAGERTTTAVGKALTTLAGNSAVASASGSALPGMESGSSATRI